MGFGTSLVLIVLILTIGQVIQTWAKSARKQQRLADDPEASVLRGEIKMLRERVAVLERIATEKNHLLEHEFEQLRDR